MALILLFYRGGGTAVGVRPPDDSADTTVVTAGDDQGAEPVRLYEGYQQADVLGQQYGDEYDFYGDDSAVAEDEVSYVAIAADSFAILVDNNTVVVYDDLLDWFDLYDAPDEDDPEWSTQIQPNAPPVPNQLFGDDAEQLDQDFEEDAWLAPDYLNEANQIFGDDAEHEDEPPDDFDAELYAPLSPNALPVPNQFFGDEAEQLEQDFDEYDWQIVPTDYELTQQIVGSSQFFGDEAEQLDQDIEEDDWRLTPTDYELIQPAIGALQCFDDFAEHEDEPPDSVVIELGYLQSSVFVMPPDDAYDHFSDDQHDDDTWQIAAISYAPTKDNNPVIAPRDEYDYGDVDQDDENQTGYYDDYVLVTDFNQILGGDDAEHEDEPPDTVVVGLGYINQDYFSQPYPDDFDYGADDQHDDDTWQIAAIDSRPVVPDKDTQYYGDDADSYQDDFEDEVWVDYYILVDNSTTIAPPDAFILDEDVDDNESPFDEYLNYTVPPGPSQFFGDDSEQLEPDYDEDAWLAPDYLNEANQFFGDEAEQLDSDLEEDDWRLIPTDYELVQPPVGPLQCFDDFAEHEDEPPDTVIVGLGFINADTPPPLPQFFGEESERLEDEATDFFADFFLQTEPDQVHHYGDEAEQLQDDIDDELNVAEFGVSQVIPSYFSQPPEDAYDWQNETQDDDDTSDVCAIDSQPVVLDNQPGVDPDEFPWSDLTENDEDTVDLIESNSGPVGTNTINQPPEDGWSWSDEAQDDDDTSDVGAIDSQPVGFDNLLPGLTDDYTWSDLTENDDDTVEVQESGAAPVVADYKDMPPEDAWDWADDWQEDTDDTVDIAAIGSAPVGPANFLPIPEDAQDFGDADQDDEYQTAYYDDYQLIDVNPQRYFDDGFVNDEDFEEDAWLAPDYLNDPSALVPDAWDWSTDGDDLEEPVLPDDFSNNDVNPQNYIDDGFVNDEDFEEDLWLAPDYLNDPSAIPPDAYVDEEEPDEDAWLAPDYLNDPSALPPDDYDWSATDDIEEPVLTDDFASINNSPTIAIVDDFSNDEDFEEDAWLAPDYLNDPSATPPDEYDHQTAHDDLEEPYQDDQYAIVDNNTAPSQPDDFAWGDETQDDDDTVDVASIDSRPVVNNFSPSPVEDAWPWLDETQDDDSTVEIATTSDAPVATPVPIGPDDAFDYGADDQHDDDTWLVGAIDSRPVVADYKDMPPPDEWYWFAESEVDDDWQEFLEYPPLIPSIYTIGKPCITITQCSAVIVITQASVITSVTAYNANLAGTGYSAVISVRTYSAICTVTPSTPIYTCQE